MNENMVLSNSNTGIDVLEFNEPYNYIDKKILKG